MLGQLLPPRLDNSYRGSRIAPWLLGLVLTVKFLQSMMSIFRGAYVASSADGIPLDTYAPAAAQAFIAIFALLGSARLPFYALCALALAKYRSAVPLMLALFALDYVTRSLILYYLPIERTSDTGGLVVNQVLFALMVVGLVLSLRRRRDASPA
jgi:MYXO-CTERM domain-containing protein